MLATRFFPRLSAAVLGLGMAACANGGGAEPTASSAQKLTLQAGDGGVVSAVAGYGNCTAPACTDIARACDDIRARCLGQLDAVAEVLDRKAKRSLELGRGRAKAERASPLSMAFVRRPRAWEIDAIDESHSVEA